MLNSARFPPFRQHFLPTPVLVGFGVDLGQTDNHAHTQTHRCTHRHTRAVQCETVSFYDIYDKRREIIPPTTFFQKKRKSLSSSSTTLNMRQAKQAQHSISRPDATKKTNTIF